jgi:hypothetical protein
VRVDWARTSSARSLAISSVFVVVATLIYLYVIFRLISDPSLDVSSPGISGVLLASDHSTFIGVITNLMFGLLLVLTLDQAARWPWADQLVFWGVNLGLVIFLGGLIGDDRHPQADRRAADGTRVAAGTGDVRVAPLGLRPERRRGGVTTRRAAQIDRRRDRRASSHRTARR